ncbi:MAG TPA: tetratricopeptide repeat protein [Burkholderiaceae bacterium]|nr:tetratricopeptide repeat protein [Burkholderiaceae bacterium]
MTRTEWVMLSAALIAASALMANRPRAMTERPSDLVLAPGGTAVAPVATRIRPLTAADLGPIRLQRPVAAATFDRLLKEAESMYRSRNLPQALDAYQTLVELDPGHSQAWLRIGNLHHQGGRIGAAMAAYRNAVPADEAAIPDPAAVGKALLNIALLAAEQVGDALERFDRGGQSADELRATRDQVLERLIELVQQARRTAAGDAGATAAAADAAVTRAASRAAAASPAGAAGDGARSAEPANPYTVDRWTGRPSARRAAGGRGTVADPLTVDPLPPRPQVEYIEGAPVRRGSQP